MSLDATIWVWKVRQKQKKGGSLKPLKKLVLLSLADRASEDHCAYPSMARLVEDTEMPNPQGDENIEETWAAHQMRTTANFARKNPVVNFLCGGLNLQVEHHLFPKICHIHYVEISEIVKETAEEFGLPYNENATFGSALKSHYDFLKAAGRASEKEVVSEKIEVMA